MIEVLKNLMKKTNKIFSKCGLSKIHISGLPILMQLDFGLLINRS